MEYANKGKTDFLKAALIIIAVTAAAYTGSLGNPFIWDDAIVIEKNDFIRSGDNFPAIFSRKYLTPYRDIGSLEFYSGAGSGETSYRPVTTLSYFLDYRFWKLNPLGYHFTNLILHILNALLLFVFAKIISKDFWIAVMASLLFALHPVNAEAVGVISFREDLLAFLFYFSSLLFYVKAQATAGKASKPLFYAVSLVTFFCALFSKEMAVTLPLILILYDYFFVFKRRQDSLSAGCISRYAAYFLVLLSYIVVSFFFIGYTAKAAAVSTGFFSGLLKILQIFAVYLQWLCFPFNLHVTLPDAALSAGSLMSDPAALLSLALFAPVVIFTFRLRKAWPMAAFAALWFIVTLLPVSNIIPITNYVACRYLYIPGAGFCLLAAAIFNRLRPGKAARYAAVLLLAVYFMLTFSRNVTWKGDINLWSEMISYYPRNALARSNLAGSLRSKGYLDEAVREYKTALSIDPRYAKDHNNLGVCYYEKAMFGEAAREFHTALELDPGLLAAYNNLGSVLGEQGLYSEAVVYFNRALNIDRRYVPAYNSLGITYARMKKFTEAKAIWQEALKISPGNPAVRENLAKLNWIMLIGEKQQI